MKKYIAFTLILVLAFLLSGCKKKQAHLTDLEAIKQRGYLIVGVKTDSAPFGFYKNDVLQGIDIEIAKNIANNVFGNERPDNITYVPVSASDKISKLNSKAVDILVATMSINEKRKLVINFSVPYYAAKQKLMVKKDSKIVNLRYFEHKGKICTILGTTAEKTLRLFCPNASVIGVKTYIEARQLLKSNQVDAVFGDDCLLSGLNDGSFRILNRAYSMELYGVAVRKSEDSKELLNIVNATVNEMLDKKKLRALKNKYENEKPPENEDESAQYLIEDITKDLPQDLKEEIQEELKEELKKDDFEN